jgi:cytochrome c
LPGPGILVAGDGAAETYAYCIACHSERLVAQQGLTWQGWEEVIELMMEEHGMAPIESPNLERVLRYLSTHYGPDRPNFPLQ